LFPFHWLKHIPSKFPNVIKNNIYEEQLFKKIDGNPREAGGGAEYPLIFQFDSDN